MPQEYNFFETSDSRVMNIYANMKPEWNVCSGRPTWQWSQSTLHRFLKEKRKHNSQYTALYACFTDAFNGHHWTGRGVGDLMWATTLETSLQYHPDRRSIPHGKRSKDLPNINNIWVVRKLALVPQGKPENSELLRLKITIFQSNNKDDVEMEELFARLFDVAVQEGVEELVVSGLYSGGVARDWNHIEVKLLRIVHEMAFPGTCVTPLITLLFHPEDEDCLIKVKDAVDFCQDRMQIDARPAKIA